MPPDLSLRGAKRRGNLGKALPIYTECRRTQSLSNLTVAALSERHGGLQYAPHCLYGARLSDLSLRGAKRRGNLGKALPIYTECRRTQSLSNLTVAALSERHGGLQYAPHCLYGARLSDLSLRGAKRRGNLAEPDRTTGKSSAKSQLPSRDCTPRALPRAQGATAPLGPRNDKLGGIAPNNLCRNYCQPVRRSLSAATDAIGAHHFNGGLYELQVPSRDCHGPFGASQ